MHFYNRLLVYVLPVLLLNSCGQSPEPDDTSKQVESGARARVSESYFQPEGLVAEGGKWQRLPGSYVYTDGPAADADGSVFFSDVFGSSLYQVDLNDEVSVIDNNTSMTKGLLFGPDGLLYGCRNGSAQIIRYNENGEVEVLVQGELSLRPEKPEAPGEFCNDLVMNKEGGLWYTDRVNRSVVYLTEDGESRVVAEGFRPNGIAISADQQMLAVTDSEAPVLHAFRIGEAGSLQEVEGYFDPVKVLTRINQDEENDVRSGANGMTVDSAGRFYLASFFGIQVYSPDGKYLGVIKVPNSFVSNIGFGGVDRDWLYATGVNGVYKLKMQAQGL